MKNSLFFLIFAILVSASSCDRRKITRTDTFTSGEAVIAVDANFQPILKEVIAVFEGTNPDAVVTPHYMSEVDALNLLLKDSVRLIVATRDLSKQEKEFIETKKLKPRSTLIAKDALALIVNKENPDSLITKSVIKRIMSGEIKTWAQVNPDTQNKLGEIKVVFDDTNSSTVRYVKDSLLMGQPLAENLAVQENHRAVIDYVSKAPNALGIIGVNWISNENDTTSLSFVDKVKVMSVSTSDVAIRANSYEPFPAYIALGYYPLTREVYVILTDYAETLPAGFVHYIAGEVGQRIIMKAGLVPGTKPTRLIQIKDSFD